MKKLFTTIIGSLFVSAILLSCGPTKKDATRYNDNLIAQQTKVLAAEDVIFETMSKDQPDQLDKAFEGMKKQLKESTEAVEKMEAFNGKTDFKDALLKLFSAFKEANEKYFPEYIAIGKLQANDFTPEKVDRMVALGKQIDDLILKANDAFIAKQKEFAEKYKFELTTTDKEK